MRHVLVVNDIEYGPVSRWGRPKWTGQMQRKEHKNRGLQNRREQGASYC